MIYSNKKKIIDEHINNLTNQRNYNCVAPINYEDMCHELVDFFLGEDWHVTDPIADSQIMNISLREIEIKYFDFADRKYRRKLINKHKDNKIIKKAKTLIPNSSQWFSINNNEFPAMGEKVLIAYKNGDNWDTRKAFYSGSGKFFKETILDEGSKIETNYWMRIPSINNLV